MQLLSVGCERVAPLMLDSSTRPPQVSRLRMAKTLVLAMEVCVYLKDEALLNQSALRLYNCVAPLITGNARSKHLAKVRAAVPGPTRAHRPRTAAPRTAMPQARRSTAPANE